MAQAQGRARAVILALGPSAFLAVFGAAIVNASDANQLGAVLIVGGVVLFLVVAVVVAKDASPRTQKWVRRVVAVSAWLGVLVGCIGLWVTTLPSDYF
ncbi:MAG: hypothetical protein ACO1ON_15835 [Nocardioides sp.]